MSTLPHEMKAVVFPGLQRAELRDWPAEAGPLMPDEVAGRTLVSLVSPGTELNWGFVPPHEKPVTSGYAAVFAIDALGSQVTDLRLGQQVFCMGNHSSRQRFPRTRVLPLPTGLTPQEAVFARLMGVSWTTLATTTARPADRVLVMGLGPVGNLAAQIFQAAGYTVSGFDPLAARQQLARDCGVREVHPAVPLEDPAFLNKIALVLECSGHEQAALDACRIVRKRGEVVLIGVPWKKRTELAAFDLLHAVFHRYVILRSGWEWELPSQPQDFMVGSIFGNLAASLEWLAERRINTKNLYFPAQPGEAQSVYSDLLHQRSDRLLAMFVWS